MLIPREIGQRHWLHQGKSLIHADSLSRWNGFVNGMMILQLKEPQAQAKYQDCRGNA
jgi:hypothetical protein